MKTKGLYSVCIAVILVFSGCSCQLLNVKNNNEFSYLQKQSLLRRMSGGLTASSFVISALFIFLGTRGVRGIHDSREAGKWAHTKGEIIESNLKTVQIVRRFRLRFYYRPEIKYTYNLNRDNIRTGEGITASGWLSSSREEAERKLAEFPVSCRQRSCIMRSSFRSDENRHGVFPLSRQKTVIQSVKVSFSHFKSCIA